MSEAGIPKPFINLGPGYTIKRFLDARGWSQEDLAQITDISTKQLSLIINDKVRITIETAKLLARAFDTSPEVWINLDTRYRLHLEGNEEREGAAARKARIRTYMPVAEMIRKGWYAEEKTAEGYEAVYRAIWNHGPEDVSEYDDSALDYCARQKRDDGEYTAYYTRTWRQVAARIAEGLRVPPFDRKRLEEIAADLPAYSLAEDGVRRVCNDLHAAGVKFFVLSHLSKTYLDGAAFYSGENPVIVYTGRYDRTDNFWFTLAHEAAHVLLHLTADREKCFIDDLQEREERTPQEKEADSKAEEMLRVEEIIAASAPYTNYLSSARLKAISRELGIDVAVILGVLQHKGLVEYRTLNRHKTKVLEQFPQGTVKG